MAASVDRLIAFGSFQLFPARQLLLDAEKPVRIGSRALDILATLTERAGQVVSKDELIARVWPDTFVEECNLRVHIAGLRRALGDGHAGRRYITNIPGRGYQFVAPVTVSDNLNSASSAPQATPRHNLPSSLTKVLGREATVAALSDRLPLHRLITVVGPGGVGKTTLALEVVRGVLAKYRDGVWFVDLAGVEDPSGVVPALASALGLGFDTENADRRLFPLLRDKTMLLLFDNCDRVIESAGSLATTLLKAAPSVNVLATSREPLRAVGEHVYHLPPLGVPAPSSALTAAEALTFPAVELFVERAIARLDSYELNDSDAPIVADICRRLDGLALAIELMAGHVEAFGVRGLLDALDNRGDLLTRGLRADIPRHRSLSAALDWSYEVLSSSERIVLRRVAVFDAHFTLESAVAIAADSDISQWKVVAGLADLVTKSLVTADVSGDQIFYRLLETTHSYAYVRLIESGERDDMLLRRTAHLRDLLERAGLSPDGKPL